MKSQPADASFAARDGRRSPLFVAALITAVAVLCFDLFDGRIYYRDVDDALRAIQIRQLLVHGRWFDLTIVGIDMPGAYVSPWSRLVDLPYVLLTFALRTVMSPENALWWAFRLWQPVLLVSYCWLWVATAVRVAGKTVGVLPLHVVASFAMMPLTLWEFMPGRIDHHNLQIVILMLALYGISRWSAFGGFLAGAACGVSFAIGLELAPVLVILMVGPGLAWISGVKASRSVQLSVAAGVASATLVTGLLLIGPSRMVSTECDALSAPYVSAFLGYATVTSIAVWSVHSGRRLIRLLSLSLPAIGIVLLLVLAFPACVDGPYGTIDPLVRSLWLDRVQQENSFLDFYRVGETIKIVSLGLLLVVVVGTLPILRHRLKERDAAFLIIFCVATALLLLTFAQTRFIRFPAVGVLLFLPPVWDQVKSGSRVTTRVTGAAAMLTLLVGILLSRLVPAEPFLPDALDYMAVDLCPVADLSVLQDFPPGRILAPSSLGLVMLDGLPPGFSIASLPFHRAAPGMLRMYRAFLSTDSAVRRDAAAPFDYLALCRFPLVEEIADDTLFAVLTRGGEWPGLVPLADGPPGSLRLFRIDHSAFR
ncbi:hypothetical protein [Rhizobium sp. SAFR-030]|uniref:hypothetical protein n=1 Tax=Rhizobium sp. SAFR-030 TaxID=3387277 RepID=UPI003F821BF7